LSELLNVSAPTTERLGVEAVPERARRAPLRAVETSDPPLPLISLQALADKEAELNKRSAALAQTAATYQVVAKVLAIRSQLLLAVIGAFVLSMYAMSWQTNAGLLVLIAWCLLTVMPLVALEWRGRPGRQ
jgi:hypothetical protein